MKAQDALAQHGLDSFGVRVPELNDALLTIVAGHSCGQERAAALIELALSQLLQKLEAISDGRSNGFRIDEDEAAVLDALISAGTHFAVRRDGMTVRAA